MFSSELNVLSYSASKLKKKKTKKQKTDRLVNSNFAISFVWALNKGFLIKRRTRTDNATKLHRHSMYNDLYMPNLFVL